MHSAHQHTHTQWELERYFIFLGNIQFDGMKMKYSFGFQTTFHTTEKTSIWILGKFVRLFVVVAAWDWESRTMHCTHLICVEYERKVVVYFVKYIKSTNRYYNNMIFHGCEMLVCDEHFTLSMFTAIWPTVYNCKVFVVAHGFHQFFLSISSECCWVRMNYWIYIGNR